MNKVKWLGIVSPCALTVAMFIGIAPGARVMAATFTNGGGDHLWKTPTNWNPAGVPKGGQARVPAGFTIDLKSDVPEPGQVYIGIDGKGTATWHMTAGSVTVTHGTFVGWNKKAVATISGGQFTDHSNNGLQVGRGAASTGSSLTINGSAKVTVTNLYSGYGAVGHLIIGGKAQVTANNINVGAKGLGSTVTINGSQAIVKTAGLAFRHGGTLNFVFDKSGVSTVNISGPLMIDNTKPTVLNIDGSKFTGSGTFDLVKFGYLSKAKAFGSVHVSGFTGKATVVHGPSSIQLRVTKAAESKTQTIRRLPGHRPHKSPINSRALR